MESKFLQETLPPGNWWLMFFCAYVCEGVECGVGEHTPTCTCECGCVSMFVILWCVLVSYVCEYVSGWMQCDVVWCGVVWCGVVWCGV